MRVVPDGDRGVTTGLRYTEAQYAAMARRRDAGPQSKHCDAVRLVIPMPPTVNHSTRPTARGGRILTDEHKAFREQVASIVARHGSPRIEGRLAVDLSIVPADKRRFDIDNRAKAVLDSLQLAGVFADDSQIDDLRIRRMPIAIPGAASACVVISQIRAAA